MKRYRYPVPQIDCLNCTFDMTTIRLNDKVEKKKEPTTSTSINVNVRRFKYRFFHQLSRMYFFCNFVMQRYFAWILIFPSGIISSAIHKLYETFRVGVIFLQFIFIFIGNASRYIVNRILCL